MIHWDEGSLRVEIAAAVEWGGQPNSGYCIEIEDKHQSRCITRCYRDFVELHTELKSAFPSMRLELPPNEEKKPLLSLQFFSKKTPKDYLELYLKSIVRDPSLLNSRPFQTFLSHRYTGDSAAANGEQDTEAGGGGYSLNSKAEKGAVSRTRKRCSVSDKDFEYLKTLGVGVMGKVYLVRHTGNNKIYALKVIQKDWVVREREVEHTKSERDILVSIGEGSHPFLITLHWSFQTASNLFLVLDYCPGGDLAGLFTKSPIFPPKLAQFYAAEIIVGLEELHRRGIIYRDLKPENVLLDRAGHVVLTDFGLSKQFATPTGGKTRTFCGTAEYLAPEILLGKEYTSAVDWWSLGAFLHEMLVGATPWFHDNHQELYRRVLEEPLSLSLDLSDEARDLLRNLLDRNPAKRLGNRLGGVQELKSHPYFRNIDWTLLHNRQLEPPYKPIVNDDLDTRNFDETFTRMTPSLPIREESGKVSTSLQDNFMNFSFENLKIGAFNRRSSLTSSSNSSRPSSLLSAEGDETKRSSMDSFSLKHGRRSLEGVLDEEENGKEPHMNVLFEH